MTSAPAIGFEYRPSRWLARALWAIALLATLALWLGSIPLLLKVLATMLLLPATWNAQTRFAHSRLRAVGWSPRDGWCLRMADGEDQPASLRAFRIVGEQIIWLHLSASNRRRHSLLLAPDNSDADIRRRLRMRLALASGDSVASPGTLATERGPTV